MQKRMMTKSPLKKRVKSLPLTVLLVSLSGCASGNPTSLFDGQEGKTTPALETNTPLEMNTLSSINFERRIGALEAEISKIKQQQAYLTTLAVTSNTKEDRSQNYPPKTEVVENRDLPVDVMRYDALIPAITAGEMLDAISMTWLAKKESNVETMAMSTQTEQSYDKGLAGVYPGSKRRELDLNMPLDAAMIGAPENYMKEDDAAEVMMTERSREKETMHEAPAMPDLKKDVQNDAVDNKPALRSVEATPLAVVKAPATPVVEEVITALNEDIENDHRLDGRVQATRTRTQFAVHLASFRSQESAVEGWIAIVNQHQDILGAMHPVVSLLDLGSNQGAFYRLKAAGFSDLAAAQAACDLMTERNQYCSLSDATGESLSLN